MENIVIKDRHGEAKTYENVQTISVKNTSGQTVTYTQGAIPAGKINITNTQETDVTNYATAQVVDANLVAGNIAQGVTVLGITGTHQGGITPTGSVSITSNGTHDVTNYASANVNVSAQTPLTDWYNPEYEHTGQNNVTMVFSNNTVTLTAMNAIKLAYSNGSTLVPYDAFYSLWSTGYDSEGEIYGESYHSLQVVNGVVTDTEYHPGTTFNITCVNENTVIIDNIVFAGGVRLEYGMSTTSYVKSTPNIIGQDKALTLGASAPSSILADSSFTLKSVTPTLDTSVIKADNIKKDVNILGVTGTYEGGGGTSSIYKFYQQDGTTEITDITVSGLANAYYYTKNGGSQQRVGGRIYFINGNITEGSGDKFYVYDTIQSFQSDLTFGGKVSGLNDNLLGAGKPNSATCLASLGDTSGTIWYFIKNTMNSGSVGGCNDWFIGSPIEYDLLISSGLISFDYNSVRSSVSGITDRESYFVYGTDNHNWLCYDMTDPCSCLAIRSF